MKKFPPIMPIIVSLLFVVCITGSIGLLYFSSREPLPLSNSEPRQAALRATEKLLDAVERHATGSLPKDDASFSSFLWVSEECWGFLQATMRANDNQYVLKVADYYNAAETPYPWRDAVEVWVQITFLNGQRAHVLFSQGGLAGCRGA